MSVVRIVLCHLKPGISPDDSRLADFGRESEAMKGKIEGLVDVHSGKTLRDQYGMGGGFDYVSVARINTQETMKAWEEHPDNAKSAAMFQELFENPTIVDYVPGKM